MLIWNQPIELCAYCDYAIKTYCLILRNSTQNFEIEWIEWFPCVDGLRKKFEIRIEKI